MRVMLYLDVMTKKKQSEDIDKYWRDAEKGSWRIKVAIVLAIMSLIATVIAIFYQIKPLNCSGMFGCLGPGGLGKYLYMLLFGAIGFVLACFAMACVGGGKRKEWVFLLSLAAVFVNLGWWLILVLVELL